MKFYHYVPFEVDALKTSKMLYMDNEENQEAITSLKQGHGETLSAFFAPLGKTNIDKLRNNGFVNYKKDLYLYEFDLNNITFKESECSSLWVLESLDHLYNKLPSDEFGKLKTKLGFAYWLYSKKEVKKLYDNWKYFLTNQDGNVELQIQMSKYDPDSTYRQKIKTSYAVYIPHMMFKITKPVTKIKLLGKF